MPKWIAGRQTEATEREEEGQHVREKERERARAPFGGHVHNLLHGN